MRKGSEQLRSIIGCMEEEGLGKEERTKLLSQQETIMGALRRFDGERQSRNQYAHNKLDNQMRVKMRGILEEIRGLVTQLTKKENFAIVFDRSGTNTNQVPSLIYGKNMTDIKAVVMQQLNKEEPLPESSQ